MIKLVQIKFQRFLFCLLFLPFLLRSEPNTPDNSIDVISYQINLKITPQKKFIEGANLIQVCALKNLKAIHLDLFWQMKVSSVIFQGKQIPYQRDSNSFKVNFPRSIKKGDTISFYVYFSGTPIEAKKAPWDGGFVWSKDSSGAPWVGLACEGLGAACWLPCKNDWQDEPNYVKISLEVPKNLVGVSNGNLVSQSTLPNGNAQFVWEVNSPINNYNISINVGDYAHWEDVYVNEKGEQLKLNYYVLKPNLEQSKTHFQQVKRMLKTFESYFGKYPFYADGYKLVETPYWGMEHQSCVAYGNNYQNNKFGFDFIIVHESGHEWFGNSITAYNRSDMWIHEGFTTYSEALFVEKQFGELRAAQYLLGQKGNIKNLSPMIGKPWVSTKKPDNDIYYKGTWILQTMRSMLDNDTLWFNMLKDLNQTFFHKIVTSAQVEKFIINRTGYNFAPFFNQYLRYAELPVFEYYFVSKNGLNELHYRLNAKVKTLRMPVKVTLGKDKFDFVVAEKSWKIYDLPYNNAEDFKLDEGHFLLPAKRIFVNP